MTSNAVQRPQTPGALRVAAAWARLRCSASSTMTRHRLERRALHPGLRRSQRDPRDFHHGLLAPDSGAGKVKRPDRSISLVLLCLCSLFLALNSCGGKKRPPPVLSLPAPGTVSVKKVSSPGSAPSIRVLLKETFREALIEGSSLGPAVRVQIGKGSIQLINGRKRHSGSGFRLESGGDGGVQLDGKPYRGTLEIFINPLGKPVIVNEVDLENYLKGVVANELDPGTFPLIEAMRAQATAARTYALSSRGQYASRGFDLYTDQRSQVYRGVSSERPLSSRAVDETRGIVAVYQGKPILAFYSSTCGGKTEDYQFVFRQVVIPYLRGGVSCQEAPNRYSFWEKRIPISRIQERLDRHAGVGKLRKLVPLKRGRSGRIVEMLFVGDRGKKTLKGGRVRFALGLPSSWILDLVPSHDPSGNIKELHVRGRGYGHGVGLCQMGSVELDRRGLTFEQILKSYYLGIDLARRY